MKKSHKIPWLIKKDTWAISEGVANDAPFLLRFRTPVLRADELDGYDQLLTILWTYAAENSGELPNEVDSQCMQQFEDRFVSAFEHDAQAVLTAVLTYDGARQWVIYTGDINECGARIAEMPQNEERYPIELTTEPDSEWEYLRQQILSRVNYANLA